MITLTENVHSHLLRYFFDKPFTRYDLDGLQKSLKIVESRKITHAIRSLEKRGQINRTGEVIHNKSGGTPTSFYKINSIVDSRVRKNAITLKDEKLLREHYSGECYKRLSSALDLMTKKRLSSGSLRHP